MKETKILSKIYIFLVVLFLYIPVIAVVIYSFNESKSAVVWTGFTFNWYKELIKDRELIKALLNSIKIALLASSFSAVVGTLGAIGLEKMNKKLKIFTTILSYTPIIIPEIVLGVALLIFFSILPAFNNTITLVLSHMLFCTPYILIMVKIRLLSIDAEIIEAARDLGASKKQQFSTITLPLIAPSIFSGWLLAMAMSLDDFIISFFLAGAENTTLPIKIYSMVRLGVSPKINALCTLILIFVYIVVGITLISKNIKKKNDTILDSFE